MATFSLLGKEWREHWVAAVFLGFGSLAVVLLLLARSAAGPYSMSAMEIVRFALLSFIPLTALIVGNRLIVREYLSGTRQFVEALPIGSNKPLVLKYLIGFLYLSLLAGGMVLLAGQQGGVVGDITVGYILLILGKTLVMTSLYWSVVFCFSLCGHLRMSLYLLCAALVALVAFYPGINSDRFAPFALMDDQLFVFEYDIVPWKDIMVTTLMSAVFTVAGFMLVHVGEGSVVERLAKPMTRRDYVALGILAAAGLGVWSTIIEKKQRDPVRFTSSHVVRLQDPSVSVLYLEESYLQSAEQVASRISESLTELQATLGMAVLPDVKLALDPDREKHDFHYATADGVFISANWLEHDSYDTTILDSVIMHGVLSAQTGGRAMFEPYHWVLDGFTRWWVEQGTQPIDQRHRAELLARAIWVLDADPEAYQLVARWQLIADRFSYPSAESVAWAAMTYLEETYSRETVFALASEFLIKPVPTNIMASIRDRQFSVRERFESTLSMSLDEFHDSWQAWLNEQRSDPDVQRYLSAIPALQGVVVSEVRSDRVYSVAASYRQRDSNLPLDQNIESLPGECVLKHDYTGPFDSEFEVTDDYEDTQPCQTGDVAHRIDSVYSPGDRVFIALDYEGGDFHQPLRLHAERLTIR